MNKKKGGRLNSKSKPLKLKITPKKRVRKIKAKKAVKKALPKATKTPTKTSKTSLQTKKIVQPLNENLAKEVPNEFSFWLCDGRIVKSVAQLSQMAEGISDETYSFHANSTKNDFAEWIRDIVKDEELSYNIRKAKDKAEFAKILKKAIYSPDIKKLPAPSPLIQIEQLKIAEPAKKQPIEPKRIETVLAEPAKIKAPTEIKKPAVVQKNETIQIQKAPEPKPVQPKPEFKPREQEFRQPFVIDSPNKSFVKLDEEDMSDLIKKREEELLKEEKELSNEEQNLNHQKIELTKKRYDLLKKRGELEKEKFQRFMVSRAKGKPPEMPVMPSEMNSVPKPFEFGKDRIETLIKEIKSMIETSNIEQATKTFLEATELFNRSLINPDEKRNLKFRLMELEADIKLAGLKKTQ